MALAHPTIENPVAQPPSAAQKLKLHLTRESTIQTWMLYYSGAATAFTAWICLRSPGWVAGLILFAFFPANALLLHWLDNRRVRRAQLEEDRRFAAEELQREIASIEPHFKPQAAAERYYHPISQSLDDRP